MTLAESIYQHSLRLPEAAAKEALDFIEFLEQRYAVQAKPSPLSQPHQRRAGSAKGKLVIISDDLDHLSDFGEYMP